MTLKELPKGEYFKRKPTAKTVYIRGDYNRSWKRFSCIDAEDINREIFLKGDIEVTQDFEY